jgi:hypothetical protein
MHHGRPYLLILNLSVSGIGQSRLPNAVSVQNARSALYFRETRAYGHLLQEFSPRDLESSYLGSL